MGNVSSVNVQSPYDRTVLKEIIENKVYKQYLYKLYGHVSKKQETAITKGIICIVSRLTACTGNRIHFA